MSIFSKACEHGIKACIYIAQQSLSGNIASVKEISAEIDAPLAFTAKILQQISKGGFLASTRGKQGGFSISEEHLKTVKIIQIIEIIDGKDIFLNCGLGLKKCSEINPCPVHHDFKVIREGLRNLTETYTLFDLATKTDTGEAWLK